MPIVTLAEERNRLTDPADPGGRYLEFGSTRSAMQDEQDGEWWQFADGSADGRTTTAVFNARTLTIPLTMVMLSRSDLTLLQAAPQDGGWRGRRLLLRTYEGDAYYVSYLTLTPRPNLRLKTWDVGVQFRAVT